MSRLKRFLECIQGVAAIEFALLLPFLAILILGATEVSRFILIRQKLEQTTSTMADLVTQGGTVSSSGLDEIGRGAEVLMRPFAFNASLIFSSFANPSEAIGNCINPNVQCVAWQYSPYGSHGSQFGSVGGIPTLPGGYQVAADQNIIGAEMYYEYQPLFPLTPRLMPFLAPTTLYATALYAPRQDLLLTLNNAR